jgi:hypothetical protein
VAVLLLVLAVSGGCPHQPPTDPGAQALPQEFRTPEATFESWRRATLAADREALGACYFQGLPAEELQAGVRENLRPEARTVFEQAHWGGASAVSPVEVRFQFSSGTGDAHEGVMVRTRAGWKVRNW